MKANKDANSFFYLEQVPGGRPLDVMYMNQGHLIGTTKRFSADAGRMVLFFENNHYDLLLEKDKWFSAGKKVLAKVLESDKSFEDWQKNSTGWLIKVLTQADFYKSLNLNGLSKEDLFELLKESCEFDVKNTIHNAEITTTNYATNFVVKEMEKVLRPHYSDFSKISQVLLISFSDSPIIRYEQETNNIVRYCFKKNLLKVDKALIGSDKILNI